MEELNLPTDVMIALIIILSVLAIYLWRKPRPIRLDFEPKTTAEGNNTTTRLNERYGAYIWLAGKRYN